MRLFSSLCPILCLLSISCVITTPVDITPLAILHTSGIDTVAAIGPIKVPLSTPLADSSVHFILKIQGGYDPQNYTTSLTAHRDTAIITLNGNELLSGSSRYVIYPDGILTAVNGSTLSASSDSLIIFTTPVASGLNRSLATADTFSGKICDKLAGALDTAFFMVKNISPYRIQVQTSDNFIRVIIAATDTSGKIAICDTIGAVRTMVNVPESLSIPVTFLVYSADMGLSRFYLSTEGN